MQLLLRSGTRQRPGWLRVDSDPAVSPDVLAEGTELPAIAADSTARVDAGDLLVHLDLGRARAALREWARVLAPGGELTLEVPDLEAAARAVGVGTADGRDPGLEALFGDPGRIEREGERARHRSAWNRRLLERELAAAGLRAVRVEVTAEGTLRARAEAPATPAGAGRSLEGRSVDGRRRFFAWPDYADGAALDRFLAEHAAQLVGRSDCVLVLGYDPARDGSREGLVRALSEAHTRVLGREAELQVTLLDEPLDEAGWRAVARHLEARIALPGDVRLPGPLALDCPVLATPADLAAALRDAGASASPVAPPAPTAHRPPSGAPRAADAATPVLPTDAANPAARETAAPAAGEEDAPVVVDPALLPGVAPRAGVPADPALIEAAAALHPWFYPVELAGHVVTPGLGSPCAPDWLRSRALHRAQLMVRGVLGRIDVRGARVLDLACNCAFWSSYFARAGAREVFGLEGRRRHVEQARLLWRTNRILPEGRWRFEVGNVSDPADWAQVRRQGPWDLTVIAGILYHVPNYDEILRWAAAVTDGALLVDTRVQEGPEELVDEPGEMRFNAIHATRRKVVPNREALLTCLRELGFETEVLPVPFGTVLGLEDCDDYSQGRRVAVLARRPGGGPR